MTVKLRRWQWKPLLVYNGFTHEERVRGWQVLSWMIDTGQLVRPTVCCITGSTNRVGYHSENYYSWDAYPLCQSVHFALHQRFKRPGTWQRIVDENAVTGTEWFAQLLALPIHLASTLRRDKGEQVAEIFARANLPADILPTTP